MLASEEGPQGPRQTPAPVPPDTGAAAARLPTVETRSPTGALLRSAVLPGWGQVYNDRPLKGVLLGGAEMGLLSWLLLENDAANEARRAGDDAAYRVHSARRLDLIWYTSAAWIYGMMDAYVDAYLYPFRAENERFETETGVGLGLALFVRF